MAIAVVAAGLAVTEYARGQLQASARNAWTREATQDVNRITEVSLTWLSNLRMQLRGIVAMHLGSSHVSEDELLDAFEVLEETRATLPLAAIAFVADEAADVTQGKRVETSSEIDGALAGGTDIDEHRELATTFATARRLPDRVVLGPHFDDESGRRLAPLAMAARNGGREGVVMALADIGDMLHSLEELHITRGLHLRLVDLGETGTTERSAPIFDNTLAEAPEELVEIVADVGHARWMFGWQIRTAYRGGPDTGHATFVSVAGSALSVLAGVIIGLLLLQNARVNRTVKERTLDLETEIGEKVKAEEQLREAVERAESANRTKSRFLANMSHEIRTPLNAIMGFTEILINRIQDATQKRHLESIRASGKSLITLIDDVLDLSRVDAGKLEMHPLPTDVCALLHEIELVYAPKASGKGLRLELEIDPGMPDALVIDDGRTRQILANLIDNAIKFTHQGQVRVRAAGSRKGEEDDRVDLVLSVADTGIGIPEDERERIFGAFDQRENQSINEYGGVGSGLALIKAFLAQSDGEINLESQVGVGSTFTVTLRDVEVATEEQIAQAEAEQTDPDLVQFDSGTLLLADDVKSNRELVKGFLDGQPFRFVEAENGEEAIAQTRQESPSLILMDIKMPVLDGFSAAQRLKSDPQLRHVPVIALTGSVLRESEDEILQVCDAFLRKPVPRGDLIREMSRLLPHRVESSSEESVTTEPASKTEGWTLEAMPPERRSRMPELALALKGLSQTWEELSATLTINDIDEFAQRVGNLGEEYGHEDLVRWSSQLSRQAVGFDVDRMTATLSEFPDRLRQIEAIGT